MSLTYLQGLFYTRLDNLTSIKESIALLSERNLSSFDSSFRQLVGKKFAQPGERETFLNKDISFHLRAIRSQREPTDSEFLQATFLPYDYLNLSLFAEGQPLVSKISYFQPEEFEDLNRRKFSFSHSNFQIKEFLVKYQAFKLKEEKIGFLNQILKKRQREILCHKGFKLIDLYFEIKEIIEENWQSEILKKKMPPFSLKFLPREPGLEIELFGFYLPWLLTGGAVIRPVNPYEFVFFYLKQRLILWKILDPYIV